MKIAFFSTHVMWVRPHFETELELMQRHMDNKDTIYHFICNGELKFCDFLLLPYLTQGEKGINKMKLCMTCIKRRKSGMKLLTDKVMSYPMLSTDIKQNINPITSFSDINQLKDYKIGNYDIGMSVLSSLISMSRNREPDIKVHSQIIKDYIYSSCFLYFSAINFIETYNLDKIYIFNGRVAHSRALVRAAQYKNIDFIVHERGYGKDKFALYENSTPFDVEYVLKYIKDLWDEETDQEKKREIGKSYFIEKVNLSEQVWLSYIKEQKYGLLPENWDETKRNIIIFNSSEDEYVAAGGEWENPIYYSELEGIKEICFDKRLDFDNIRIYVRIHPNLKDVNNQYLHELYNLKSKNLTIIPPDSQISSYSLLQNCEKVLSFGSTVGIEAVFWGKPSILVGTMYYKDLGGTYNTNNHKEVIDLILARLEPKDKEPALMYGYFMKTFGIPYKYYEAKDFFNGAFKGHIIEHSFSSFYKKIYDIIPYNEYLCKYLLAIPQELFNKYMDIKYYKKK